MLSEESLRVDGAREEAPGLLGRQTRASPAPGGRLGALEQVHALRVLLLARKLNHPLGLSLLICKGGPLSRPWGLNKNNVSQAPVLTGRFNSSRPSTPVPASTCSVCVWEAALNVEVILFPFQNPARKSHPLQKRGSCLGGGVPAGLPRIKPVLGAQKAAGLLVRKGDVRGAVTARRREGGEGWAESGNLALCVLSARGREGGGARSAGGI